MNIIDILLVLVVILAVWSGVKKGFITGLGGLVSWIGSLVVAFWLYRYVSVFFYQHVWVSIWTAPLAFLAILLLISLVFSAIVNQVVLSTPPKTHNHRLNRFFGLLPGLVVGILYAAILSALLLLLPLSAKLTAHARASKLVGALTPPLENLEQQLSPALENVVSRTMNRMTIDPSSSKRIDLPFTVDNPTPRPDLETDMLELLNTERGKVGLPPLAHDPELVPVARKHSEDMFTRAYFSHVSPEGDTPFERIRQADLSFLTAGENLAIAQTLALAHEGLMNSPGHRKNILQPTFGRIGIGILDGGVYGLMITQKFRN